VGFLILWQIITIVQGFFAYGTAYRLTKNGGDNGVALFGWMLVMGLAAAIPGLGIYLWFKYRDHDSQKPTDIGHDFAVKDVKEIYRR